MVYIPGFFFKTVANDYFKELKSSLKWQQDEIKLFGKKILQPRLTALYGDSEKEYTYSGLTMQPLEWTEELLKIKKAVELFSDTKFTTCLANLYRNGQDSMGWHSDDEKELGENPEIASISFGGERWFHLKHKYDSNLKKKILLKNGSLLLMKGETQHYYKHQIPKTRKDIDERINLTFRKIY
nr:alpha-ketoglutarate-dependent dioxygenase AlkB [Gramella sp. AN32]